MRLDSINQQQNFKGSLLNKSAQLIAKHPVAVAGLAGSSVIAQKIVMSGAEGTIGPCMDVAIGKTITKVTDEKDGRTNQSAKIQAARTCAQSIGGTITGVTIRGLAILGATAALSKAGEKVGSKIAEVINPEKLSKQKDLYKFKENASAWGKTVGGAAAILVMTVTNFLIDVPFINAINNKICSKFVNKEQKTPASEVKNG